MRIARIVAGTVLVVGVAASAFAQPFTLDEKIKPTELKLEPYGQKGEKTAGRLYGAVITQTEPTQYYFVRNVSIFSPDYVAIGSQDPSAPIQISVHKNTWEQADRKGQTDASGRWNTKFKTSGDFGIRVTPDRLPATYAVLVWVGNEVDVPMPSPFTKSSGVKTDVAPFTGGGWLGRFGLYGLVGLIVVVIAGAALYRSKSARMFFLIAALVGAPLVARNAVADEGAYGKAVGDLLEQLKSFLEHQENVKDFWEALEGLSKDEALPDESQRGPTLPSSCLDAAWTIPPQDRAISSPRYQACQCMTDAVDKLRRNRQMLEKLRIIVANQKNFVDKAIALGNSFAQLHTVLGLQWIGVRKHDIEEPYDEFKRLSNQKHQAVMAAVQKDLKDISDCEAKLGEPDWYQKFGFMYYEFLYAAYKPSF